MLRRIFSAALLAAAILFSAQAWAASVEVSTVSVILEPPAESFEKPEEIFTAVQQTVDKIFRNAAAYDIPPIDEAAGYVEVYREENPEATSGFLKKSDIEKIAAHLGSDFVIYLRVAGNSKDNSGLESIIGGQKINVVLDFRVWSKAANDFTYTKRVTKTDFSVDRALTKCLQDVEKDAARVRAAM